MAARDVVRRTAAVFVLIGAVVLVTFVAGCGRPEYDGDLAFTFLERQCEFGPRPPGSDAHEAMREWLIGVLQGYADEVSVQQFTVLDTDGLEVKLSNVIASFRMDARERVLFGAHWDTRRIAERDPDEMNRATPISGANDGASGVAVLLALASMMSVRSPDVGVDLVFFDGEDGGNGGGFDNFCIGSTVFAGRMGDYAPAYAVVVDMVGDRDLAIPVEPNSASACPSIVRMVWDAAERVGATSFSDGPGTAMFDDHIPLIQAGVPAVLIIDFDYAHWHTVGDTPDKCSPRSLREVGAVLAELIY
ncbi:MAG: M28 family peptidase [Candidatus Eisenbacteria bacterium]